MYPVENPSFGASLAPDFEGVVEGIVEGIVEAEPPHKAA